MVQSGLEPRSSSNGAASLKLRYSSYLRIGPEPDCLTRILGQNRICSQANKAEIFKILPLGSLNSPWLLRSLVSMETEASLIWIWVKYFQLWRHETGEAGNKALPLSQVIPYPSSFYRKRNRGSEKVSELLSTIQLVREKALKSRVPHLKSKALFIELQLITHTPI